MHFWLARSWIHLIRLLAKLGRKTVELNILLQCGIILNKTKYFKLRLDEVSSETPKRDLRLT